MDTFRHTPNTQKDNANAIFTSEKLDKSDELIDAVNNLKINDAEYYQSNKVTASDAQGDITHNLETITHTKNGNETVTHTRNDNSEQKLLSIRTIPVVVPTMDPRIDQIIALIVVLPQALLTLTTKEVVAYVVSSGGK